MRQVQKKKTITMYMMTWRWKRRYWTASSPHFAPISESDIQNQLTNHDQSVASCKSSKRKFE